MAADDRTRSAVYALKQRLEALELGPVGAVHRAVVGFAQVIPGRAIFLEIVRRRRRREHLGWEAP
jgi:hypothetical protein